MQYAQKIYGFFFQQKCCGEKKKEREEKTGNRGDFALVSAETKEGAICKQSWS